MHYYLSKICCLCLGSNIELIDVCSSAETFKEINYTFPEITNELTETPLFICTTCQSALRFFHSYKRTCLNNYERWLTYIRDMKKDSDQDVKFCEFKIVLNKLQLYLTVDSDTEDEDYIPQEEKWQVDDIKTEYEDEPSSSSEKIGLLELKKLYCDKCKKIFKLYVSKPSNESLTGPPDVKCMFCNNILIETPSEIMQLLKQNTFETNENKTKEISMDEIRKNEKYRLLKVAKQKTIKTNAKPSITVESVQETIEPIGKTNDEPLITPESPIKTSEPIKKTNAFVTCKPIQELLEKTKKLETNDKPLSTLQSLLKTTEPMKKTHELLSWQPVPETIGKTNLRLIRVLKKRKLETNEMAQKTSEPVQKTNQFLTCKPIEEIVEKSKKLKTNVETYENKYLEFVGKQKKTFEPMKKSKKLETNEVQFVTYANGQETIEPMMKTNKFLICKPIEELVEKTKRLETNIETNEDQFITFANAQETIEPMKKSKKLETNEVQYVTYANGQETIEPMMKTNKFLICKPIEELVGKTKQLKTNENRFITFESAQKTIGPVERTKQLETNENPLITYESAQKTIEPVEKTNELLTCKPIEELVEQTKKLETNVKTNENQFVIYENAQKTIEPMEKINELRTCKPIQELVEKTKQLETNIKTSENQFVIFENAQKTIEPMEKTSELLTCKPIQELVENKRKLETNIDTSENPFITFESAEKTIEPVEKTNELLTCKPIQESNETNENQFITFESAQKTIEPMEKTSELLICKPMEKIVEKINQLETNEKLLITFESAQITIEPMQQTKELQTCKPIEELIKKTKKLETNENPFITSESVQKTIEPIQQTNELQTCQPVPESETVEKTNENDQIQTSDEICNNETEIVNFTENMRLKLRKKLIESNKLKPGVNKIIDLTVSDNTSSPGKTEQLQTIIPKRHFRDDSHVMTYMSLSDDKLSGKCKICYKTFPTKPLDNFERHILLHIRNGTYQCSRCKKKFMFKSNLEKHMKMYHKFDEFSCNLCDRVFATNVAKILHILGHKDETVAQNVVI